MRGKTNASILAMHNLSTYSTGALRRPDVGHYCVLPQCVVPTPAVYQRADTSVSAQTHGEDSVDKELQLYARKAMNTKPPMDEEFFDYEYLPSCQYPVPSAGMPEPEVDCGASAVARVWWHWPDDDDMPTDAMLLCEEHFQHVLACEQKSNSEETENDD